MLISICFLVGQDEPKNTQSARFELAREDPIWFLVRRLNHSAMTACGLLDSSKSLLMFSVFYLYSCRLRWAKQLRRIPCWFLLCFPVVQDERKITQSARFELAREDPIWFLVRRLNHSAMTACGLLDSSKSLLMFSVFYLYSCRFRWAKQYVVDFCLVVQDEPKNTQSARFELAREDPIWFLVRRLNHSAMTACGLSGSFCDL